MKRTNASRSAAVRVLALRPQVCGKQLASAWSDPMVLPLLLGRRDGGGDDDDELCMVRYLAASWEKALERTEEQLVHRSRMRVIYSERVLNSHVLGLTLIHHGLD
jgi:hypothetical protein